MTYANWLHDPDGTFQKIRQYDFDHNTFLVEIVKTTGEKWHKQVSSSYFQGCFSVYDAFFQHMLSSSYIRAVLDGIHGTPTQNAQLEERIYKDFGYRTDKTTHKYIKELIPDEQVDWDISVTPTDPGSLLPFKEEVSIQKAPPHQAELKVHMSSMWKISEDEPPEIEERFTRLCEINRDLFRQARIFGMRGTPEQEHRFMRLRTLGAL